MVNKDVIVVNKTYLYIQNAVFMDKPGDNAEQRRHAIFQEYERVLKNHGTNATKFAKKEIYREVASNLNYSFEWVRKVIAYYLKNKH